MHLLKRTLLVACFALTFAMASTMLTSEASAQVIHVGPGGGGVHWGGGSVHWGHGGAFHGGGIVHVGHGGFVHGGHGGIIHGGHLPHGPHLGNHVWHNTTHLDWHPGQWVQHGNHLDWQAGHWDVHETGHWDHFPHHPHPHPHP